MNGGNGDQAGERILLWGAAILFAFLVLCPLTAIAITSTTHSSESHVSIGYSDIYRENGLQRPFWPLEKNIGAGLSEEQAESIDSYMDRNTGRNTSGYAGRMDFGACRAVFIDCGDFVHEIVFYNKNTTEYDLVPELMAENSTVIGGDEDLTTGYRMYRIYPEFPAHYNADLPYIDFTDIWEDSSVSCPAGEIVRVRTEGRFYQNSDGKVTAVIDMTEMKSLPPLVFGNEKISSSQSGEYVGTVSFRGEYIIPSIPVMPEIYVESHVNSGPYSDVEISSFSDITLSSSVGAIGLLVYLFLLVMSGQEVFKYLFGRRKDKEKTKK